MVSSDINQHSPRRNLCYAISSAILGHKNRQNTRLRSRKQCTLTGYILSMSACVVASLLCLNLMRSVAFDFRHARQLYMKTLALTNSKKKNEQG